MSEHRAKDLKVRQDKIDELQRALQNVGKEKEDLTRLLESKEQVLVSQTAQVAQLSQARDQLQAQVNQLEAALQDVDTKRQMELLKTQYEQVNSCWALTVAPGCDVRHADMPTSSAKSHSVAWLSTAMFITLHGRCHCAMTIALRLHAWPPFRKALRMFHCQSAAGVCSIP